jgi:hypothetical protein
MTNWCPNSAALSARVDVIKALRRFRIGRMGLCRAGAGPFAPVAIEIEIAL